MIPAFQFALHHWVLASFVLAAALGLHAVMRKRPAAVRHLALSATFYVVVFAPALALTLGSVLALPHLDGLPVVTYIINITPDTAAEIAASPGASERRNWPAVAVIVWLAGGLLFGMRFVAGLLVCRRKERLGREESRMARMSGDIASRLGLRRQVTVLVTPGVDMPETHGVARPLVLLPESAESWPDSRLESVLTHEMIHVRRNDWLAQMIAQAGLCLHWFNPLAWAAVRRMRIERELACDDGVLAAGIDGCRYAQDVLEVAAGLRGMNPLAGAVAMAEASQLENRIRSMLNPQVKRGDATMKTKAAAVFLTAGLILTLAGWQAPAQSGGVPLSGVVFDASAAVVPEAVVLVRNVETKKREIAKTNAVGEFQFDGLPAGTYRVEISKPGFHLYIQDNVTLVAGIPQQLNVQLAVGRINETVNVTGSRPPQPVSTSKPPQRIKVGGSVQAAKLVNRVLPSYPVHLKEAHIEGTVLLEAVIGTDGSIVNLTAVNSLVHPDLVKVAEDAVRQWQYEPTFLNGNPVEVLTNITVNFTLSQ
jgi:TonB family protein